MSSEIAVSLRVPSRINLQAIKKNKHWVIDRTIWVSHSFLLTSLPGICGPEFVPSGTNIADKITIMGYARDHFHRVLEQVLLVLWTWGTCFKFSSLDGTRLLTVITIHHLGTSFSLSMSISFRFFSRSFSFHSRSSRSPFRP